MRNDCFWCKQEIVHRHLLAVGMIGSKGFESLRKLWKNCKHNPNRIDNVLEARR